MAALYVSPRPKQRSSSLKKPRRRQLENIDLDEMRPRTTSLPTRNTLTRPGMRYLSPNLEPDCRWVPLVRHGNIYQWVAVSSHAESSMEDVHEHAMRPRTTSLPGRNHVMRSGAGDLSSIEEPEGSVQPLRSFITTPKGLVNRGDSLRSRSTSSVLSSCSGSMTELTPQSRSRTSSSVSYGSACSHSPGVPGSPVPPTSPVCGRAECPYKVTVLGCCGVGKRSLTHQFTTSQYLGGMDSPFSQECDREMHMSVLLDGAETALDFFTPVENLDLHSVPNTDAFVVVFTIDDRSTFERGTDLLYELRKIDMWAGPVILVANKCDLVRTRDVSTEEATSVATTYDCKYIETSVVLNHNVDELLVGVVSQIRLKATPSKKSSAHGESSCYARSKHLLNKIFKKDALSKSCENLYVL